MTIKGTRSLSWEAKMNATRAWESDTASEEDEPDRKLQKNTSKMDNTDPDVSDTCSEEDLNIVKTCHHPFKCLICLRSPFTPKIEDHEAPVIHPKNNKIKSRIMGPKTRGSSSVKRDIPTPTSAPPLKRVKTLPENPSPKAPSVSTPEVAEEVLHHSGRINLSQADGPVSLFPYENKYAEGGFSVEVRRKGVFVGLISSGEELKCRKLLNEGWKGELRYLEKGRSDIIMRKYIADD